MAELVAARRAGFADRGVTAHLRKILQKFSAFAQRYSVFKVCIAGGESLEPRFSDVGLVIPIEPAMHEDASARARHTVVGRVFLGGNFNCKRKAKEKILHGIYCIEREWENCFLIPFIKLN